MLVLSRKKNEVVVIPGINVEIRVLSIQGDCVKLGIEAPKDVRIWRKEIMPKEDHSE